jgi:hypothetical protein
LDLLSPESSPTGAFEVMVICGIGKTPFHQLLAASAITTRIQAVGLGAGYI